MAAAPLPRRRLPSLLLLLTHATAAHAVAIPRCALRARLSLARPLAASAPSCLLHARASCAHVSEAPQLPPVAASSPPAAQSPARARSLVCAEAAPASRGVAIVTGGTGGIGLATAKRLATQGFDLLLCYGFDDARAEASQKELEASHEVKVKCVRGDLTTEESRDDTVRRVFSLVDEDYDGRVGALVHAAGYFHSRLLEHHLDGSCLNFTVYDEYQSIYPKAFVALTEGCLPRMSDGLGRIVCITNPGCNTVQLPRVGYDMPGQAKATMEYIVRTYALRIAKRGLCVNAVSPGYTDTKEWDKAREQMGGGDIEAGRQILDQRILSRSPMRRWASPEEIAQTVAFLCGEQTGLITGAFIPVDGGLHLA